MKRLTAILTLITMIVCVSAVFAETPAKKAVKPVEKAAAEQAKAVKKAVKEIDANAVTDANGADEPNKVSEVEKGFEAASESAEKEYQEVTRQSAENRVKMMTAMQKQAVAELVYIRNLAVQEGATKTVQAVDLAIEKQKDRYEERIQSMKDRQEREAGRAEREAKRTEREHTKRKPRP